MAQREKGMYYTLEFKTEEADLARWLNAQSNKGAYLKALIAIDKAFSEKGEGLVLPVDKRTTLEKQWDETYALVQEFQELQGRLPAYNETYKGVRIGRWLETRMQRDKDNPERFAKLNSLNVQSKWEQHYQMLLAFMVAHGRLPKQKEKYNGFNLGIWLFRQRRLLACVGEESSLTQEQREKILQLGVGAGDWETKLQMVQDFQKEFGRVPKYADTYRGVKLGRWLSDQRKLLARSNDREKIEKLKQVGAYTRNTKSKKTPTKPEK